jgi:hypothetical protein
MIRERGTWNVTGGLRRSRLCACLRVLIRPVAWAGTPTRAGAGATDAGRPSHSTLHVTGPLHVAVLICVYLFSSVGYISFAAPMTQPPGPTTRIAAPTTQPASMPSLPDDFAILKSRNGFAHGRGGPGGPNGPGAGPQGPRGPEAALVFRGAVDESDHFTAFIEDINVKRVMELPSGAPVGRGRIKSIDLDSIVYESGGASRRIEVGQNLEGQVVPPTPTSKPAGPQPPLGPQGPMPPGQGPPGPEQMPPGRGAPAQRAARGAQAARSG